MCIALLLALEIGHRVSDSQSSRSPTVKNHEILRLRWSKKISTEKPRPNLASSVILDRSCDSSRRSNPTRDMNHTSVANNNRGGEIPAPVTPRTQNRTRRYQISYKKRERWWEGKDEVTWTSSRRRWGRSPEIWTSSRWRSLEVRKRSVAESPVRKDADLL
jgi:hypothetical protein